MNQTVASWIQSERHKTQEDWNALSQQPHRPDTERQRRDYNREGKNRECLVSCDREFHILPEKIDLMFESAAGVDRTPGFDRGKVVGIFPNTGRGCVMRWHKADVKYGSLR